MAMIVARSKQGATAECDSAAGNLKGGQFVSGKSTAAKAKEAIRKAYGDQSQEYKDISAYKPKPLSSDLVNWADEIHFLGQEFMDNAVSKFPNDKAKMRFYCQYKSKLTGKVMHEVPDPFDGQSWRDYYDTPWPGKVQQSYDDVLLSMRTEF